MSDQPPATCPKCKAGPKNEFDFYPCGSQVGMLHGVPVTIEPPTYDTCKSRQIAALQAELVEAKRNEAIKPGHDWKLGGKLEMEITTLKARAKELEREKREADETGKRLVGALPDPSKLHILATWLDEYDYSRGEASEGNECQRDLRLWADNATAALASAPAHWREGKGDPLNGWIDVKERLPKSEIPVLAYFKNELGKGRRIRAFYVPPKTVESSPDSSEYEDNDEYDEAKDCYWVKSGWYESNEHDEVAWRVDVDVTHWRHLPDPPGEKE